MDNRDAYLTLDLTPYFNNDGISSDAGRNDGDFNGVGETYPEEDLPASSSLLECNGVVFRFPDKRDGTDNNIALEGQHIPIPKDVYDGLFLLGASVSGYLEDVIRFMTAGGDQEEAFLGLSAWYKGHSLKYGEQVAVRCSGYHCPAHHVYTDRLGVSYGVWMQRAPIRTARPLIAIELPENPGMHIFAMTLHRAEVKASQEER